MALNFCGSPFSWFSLVIQFVGHFSVVAATPSMLAMREFRTRLNCVGEIFMVLEFNQPRTPQNLTATKFTRYTCPPFFGCIVIKSFAIACRCTPHTSGSDLRVILA